MKKLGFIALVSASMVIGAGPAGKADAAFCMSPSAPSTFLNKPSKPYCARNRDCSQWQVDSYKRDVENYNRQLRQYLSDVDRFYENAYDYAKCMAVLD